MKGGGGERGGKGADIRGVLQRSGGVAGEGWGGGRVGGGGRWQGEDICTWSAETRFVAPKVYTLN